MKVRLDRQPAGLHEAAGRPVIELRIDADLHANPGLIELLANDLDGPRAEHGQTVVIAPAVGEGGLVRGADGDEERVVLDGLALAQMDDPVRGVEGALIVLGAGSPSRRVVSQVS